NRRFRPETAISGKDAWGMAASLPRRANSLTPRRGRRYSRSPKSNGAGGRAVITCPKCSKENQDHYKFCLGCGAELPRDTAPKAFSPQTPGRGIKAGAAPVVAAPAARGAPVAAAPAGGGGGGGGPGGGSAASARASTGAAAVSSAASAGLGPSP